jgi:hypothetical protein
MNQDQILSAFTKRGRQEALTTGDIASRLGLSVNDPNLMGNIRSLAIRGVIRSTTLKGICIHEVVQ